MTAAPGSLASNTTDWHLEEALTLEGYGGWQANEVRAEPAAWKSIVRLANYLASKGIEPPMEAVTCPFEEAAQEVLSGIMFGPDLPSWEYKKRLIALAKRGAEVATAQKAEVSVRNTSHGSDEQTEPLALLIAREDYAMVWAGNPATMAGIRRGSWDETREITSRRSAAQRALDGWRPE